jgi:hypothetical protein
MINIDKKYRTRDGREVRIYATDGGRPCPVHGTIFSKELGWLLATWSVDGHALNDIGHPADLIEVKPRIKRTVWINIYKNGYPEISYSNKLEADANRNICSIACVKVEIDCEEGEGL